MDSGAPELNLLSVGIKFGIKSIRTEMVDSAYWEGKP
jgi:hypothetical protein